MLKAVNLGDDTDTVAAIAGGLAGLYYGYDNIPDEWLEVLRKREWLEDLLQ
jgi:ADP-ribosylglycohydrolase